MRKLISPGRPSCEHEDCRERATKLVYSRESRSVQVLCEEHAEFVVDQGGPEYIVSCPNCDCLFGVN